MEPRTSLVLLSPSRNNSQVLAAGTPSPHVRRVGSLRRCMAPQSPTATPPEGEVVFRNARPPRSPPLVPAPTAAQEAEHAEKEETAAAATPLSSAPSSEVEEAVDDAPLDLLPASAPTHSVEAVLGGSSEEASLEVVLDEVQSGPLESPVAVRRPSVTEPVPEEVVAEKGSVTPSWRPSCIWPIPEALPEWPTCGAGNRVPSSKPLTGARTACRVPHPPAAEWQHSGRGAREVAIHHRAPHSVNGHFTCTNDREQVLGVGVAIHPSTLEQLIGLQDDSREEWRRAVKQQIDRNARALCLADAKRQQALAAIQQHRQEERLMRRQRLQEVMGRLERVRRQTRRVKETARLARRPELPSLALLAKEHAFVCDSRLNAPSPPPSNSHLKAQVARAKPQHQPVPKWACDLIPPPHTRVWAGGCSLSTLSLGDVRPRYRWLEGQAFRKKGDQASALDPTKCRTA
eukprot:GGOE01021716.1.p1 GENE.GGOE01021716.1~~GGOE01021716.1.p1  ORF type:complete len:459 (+),score=63.61 GGOE01021716.1:80-1456(+)